MKLKKRSEIWANLRWLCSVKEALASILHVDTSNPNVGQGLGCFSTARPTYFVNELILLRLRDIVKERIHSIFMSTNVRLEDLIDANDIAEMLGLSYSTAVSLYQQRYPDMPRPVINKSNGRTKLWLKPEIKKWAKATGRIS